MKKQLKLSVLDLCPLLSGKTATYSFMNTKELALLAEELGYERYWLAEHHNMQGIGSSAPEVLIAYIAQATKKIRVGSGGIMLPNHASLHVAEVFKTLEALFPNRIDLGIGRAPGSGSKAAMALRSERGLSADLFPEQFKDLLSWLEDDLPSSHKYSGVDAIPMNVTSPEVWLLGSSDFGAMMAGHYGLPYSFAQHFSHMPALSILELYHENFRPSPYLKEPKAMMGVHIICAETDEKAEELALPTELAFSLFVQSGKSIPLPTVEEARAYPYSKSDWDNVKAASMPKFVGSPETIKQKLRPYLDSGLIDELIITTMVHDQDARKESYRLITKALLQ
jgi:luciferase family oxidoreductase group 1